MTPQQFSKYMNQLMVVFTVESRAHEDVEVLVDTYSRHFINMDPVIFGKAVDLLIETHPVRMIPTVAELNSAVADIKHDMPKEQHYGEECPKCQGMGMWIDEADGLAKACHCPIGEIRRANWAAHDGTHKYFKSPSRFGRKPEADNEPY